jgi:hypothetical protein
MPASSIKQLVMSALKNPTVQRTAAGATGGAVLGRYVTPKAFGYEDNPAATNMSTLMDAILYGAIAGYGPKGLKALGPKAGIGLAASIPAAELAPVGMDLLTKGRGAVTQGSQSMKELAEASKGIRPNPSVTEQLGEILTSRAAKGAGVGATLAGLGAMTTGLTRAQSEEERREGKGRGSMVMGDFLKYVIPAMVAGGAVGHFTGDGSKTQA